MVLINNLTIDEINAALLHLQRSRTEVVGGQKESGTQNVSITNNVTGSTTDWSNIIDQITKRLTSTENQLELQKTTNEMFKDKDTALQNQINEILNMLDSLSSAGITDMYFDESTRELVVNTEGDSYSVYIPSEEVELSVNGSDLTLTMGEQTTTVTLDFIPNSARGVANGVATLDSSGRIPFSQLPESAMEFLGQWDASTNTPHLEDGVGTNGDFYIVSTGGTVNFGTSASPRNITFYPNDRVVYDGGYSEWFRLPAGAVSSVNGMSGAVVLNGTNVNYDNTVGSPTLKAKIDDVETKADIQVDWNESSSTSLAYIKNKPTIPAPQVQADWTQTNSASMDFIKHKIPIWIASGTAADEMDPVDSVQNGQMKPVTSNAVYNVLHPNLLIGGPGATGNKITFQGQTTNTNTYADTNPKIVFSNETASQNVSLTFTDYDSIASPASLTLNGNQGGEYFIAPNIKSTGSLFSNGYQQKRLFTINASSLSSSNFYPVTFDPSNLELDCEIHSPGAGGSAAYNQNVIHFLFIAQGWSDTPKHLTVLNYDCYDYNEKTIGCIGGGNQNGVNCIWVRGGLSYSFYCNRTPTLRTSNYTYGNEVFTVGTNFYGGTNSNVTVYWTPNNTYGSYFSRNIQGTVSAVATSFLLDTIYPVGSIYMSTTHTSPQTFLGGTWEEFTDGRFLRASGGNAGTVGSIQAEGLPNITGRINNTGGTYGVMGFDASSSSFTGAFTGGTFSGYSRTGQSSSHTGAKEFAFYASNGNSTVPDGATSGTIYGNSTHVTPKNMAVYMWRRTA